MLWQQLANGIAIGSVYALISLGLTMVYGILRILHVAHAGIYALGAYVGLFSFRLIGNFWLSLFIGMAGAAVAGYLVERFLYTPLLHLPRIAPSSCQSVSSQRWRKPSVLFAGPIHWLTMPGLAGRPFIGSFHLTETQILILFVTFAVLVFLWAFLTKTRTGLAMRACAQDPETTSSFGVNGERHHRRKFPDRFGDGWCSRSSDRGL